MNGALEVHTEALDFLKVLAEAWSKPVGLMNRLRQAFRP
jgi:hypothetical protein